MINENILEKLICFTDEEIDNLNGHNTFDKSIFLNKSVIDYHKLLNNDQLISVRKHARFFDYPNHSHNYIEMSYVYGGSMTHIIDGKEVCINEGEMLLLNRDIEHSIKKTGENDIIFNFIINPIFFDYISTLSDGNVIFNFILDATYSRNHMGQYLLFHCSDNKKIKEFVEEIITYVYQIDFTSNVKLKLLVGLLLMELMSYPDIIESYKNDNFDKIICTTVLNYIAHNYKDCSLQEIAVKLHQPDYRISKLMKHYTNATFKQHLTTIRLEKAIDLLEQTGLAIVDIMNEVGYENLTHFYKIFKNKYHMTPNDYRTLRKNN